MRRRKMKRPERHRLRSALMVCLLILGMPLLALAQEATIVGTVTDPSGLVVPNVTIKFTNTLTGLVTTAVTNEAGHYVAPNLRIGKYNLSTEAPGFKRLEQKDI